ncbi:MAG: VOC family protein [Desulfobacterales bacterium]|nr:VOC family protein [Desulfobacterales bacterium]
MKFSSQITFLYFKDLKEPAAFFEDLLGFEIADDQGFAKIYKAPGGAFIGVVDEAGGHCRAPSEQNVLITLVTDDVHEWYERLKEAGIAIEAPPKIQEAANVECFFFQGPGGYAFEIQRFLSLEISKIFRPGQRDEQH